MATIFSKIVNGEIPCHRIAETKDFLAFLDINPLTEGHTLVIPKKEVDYIFDLDEETFIGLQLFSKLVSEAIGKAIQCKRVGVAVIGLEVPHAHIHLIPIKKISDMDFSNSKLELSEDQLAEIATKIKDKLPG